MPTLPDLVGRPPNPAKRTPPRLLLIHTTLLPELAMRPPDPATRAPDPRPTGRPRAASAAEWMEGGGQCRLARFTHAVWHLLASPRPQNASWSLLTPPRPPAPAAARRAADSSCCGTSLCRRASSRRQLLVPWHLQHASARPRARAPPHRASHPRSRLDLHDLGEMPRRRPS
jgi:hypothetical protein